MNLFRKGLKFKYDWRSYQKHFLDGFDTHITDNHLHVIAPPGSGKTILGLEILIRIGKPTLVLAPTLTIRNQWRDRLLDFFDENANFEAYSLNIKKPALITFSTYQSLFALDNSLKEKQTESLITFIEKHNIETLVLDEAHHLQNGWWQCLFALTSLKNLTIVALTATPPYDSSTTEVNRYFDLCGPIDDEIGVPDLIKNGDLCPHQDFIYFSRPEEAQIKYIVAYRENILNFTQNLIKNIEFQELLNGLELYRNPMDSLEIIYQEPSFFSAILIYLKAGGADIDIEKLKILGFQSNDTSFPSFSYGWAEVLLQSILVEHRDWFPEHEKLLSELERELRHIGVFENRKVDFVGDNDLYRNLANSPSKLRGIGAILEHATAQLKEETRAVVLTDFIRKEFLDVDGKEVHKLNRLGVLPIFQYLLTNPHFDGGIGVLTGSLIVLKSDAIPRLVDVLDGVALSTTALFHRPDYSVIRVPQHIKNEIVAAVTQLFEEGTIKILIGTKALLGEGWDAPSINTLVLASYVGSFVSSNQMRGRAIRVDTDVPHKTGNIWHLACLDPTALDGGKDMEKLKQRFQAFSGVTMAGEPYIENGLDRMGLPEIFDESITLEGLNRQMLNSASERTVLKDRWNTAISKGSILTRELKIPYRKWIPYEANKRLKGLNAAKYLSMEIIAGLSFFCQNSWSRIMALL